MNEELETRQSLMVKIHELSCTHEHKRADECAVCMRLFEPVIESILNSQLGGAK